MDSVVLAARIVLAAVFIVAAAGKFVDLKGSRASLVGFGVPQRLADLLGTLLPFAELAVAIALIPGSTALAGGIGALVLLGSFVAGISNALRKGEAPPCNCFGAIHSAPASRTTLARNIALAALAVVVVGWGPGPEIGSWVDARSAAELVAVATGAAALALLLIAPPMWLENRRLRTDLAAADDRLKRIPPGLRVGSLAPEFSLPDGEGGTMTLSSLLRPGKPVVLVFTIAGCGPCEPMLPSLRRLQEIAADRVTIGLIGIHSIKHYDRMIEAHGGDLRLADAVVEDPSLEREIDETGDVAHLYDIHDSPGAVAVTAAGTIASTVVSGRPAVEALIRLTMNGRLVAPPREALGAPTAV
jgi:peroxiredoxin/uncharacterized membrane protein YphA (DoxX/SURF4 family)